MKATITMILAAALAGCGTTWTQPGRTDADWERDFYECQRDASAQADAGESTAMRQRCMRLKGWRPA